MKAINTIFFIAGLSLFGLMYSCTSGDGSSSSSVSAPAVSEAAQPAGGGQASVSDDDSQKDIVKVAVGSADHTTLVTALKAAGLVDALANAGPFTVFAPTNDAFGKLPPGTVDDLLKPENLDKLKGILQYHVTPGVYKAEALKNGQKLGMVNAQNAVVSVADGKVKINDANVVASVQASNGVIHVVDGVLLPQ